MSFDLPAEAAEQALKRFAAQSGLEVLFVTETAAKVKTNAVKGEYSPKQAIDRMLAGTILVANEDANSGAMKVSRTTHSNGQTARQPVRDDHARDSQKKNITETPQTQEPMKRNKLLTQIAAILTLMVVAPADAQVAPAAGTLPEKESKTIEMSPFEVSAGSDEGYAARETLAGTRFKSELKDVPSQISVMTKEFLQDIGSVTMEDAYRYSANVENLAEFTGAKDTNAMSDPDLGIRIRGLTSPGLAHDFFRTFVRQDSYNIERMTISSGPNAILFGTGNPGGIVDIAFSRPNLQRPKYEISFRNDNYNSFRTAIDLNQPLIKDRLGIRFAAMNSRQQSWRKPAGRDDDRHFGTLSVKPFASTTVRAYYEKAVLDDTPARNVRTLDMVTPWIQAGRPAFNNGLLNPDTISAANGLNRIFARNTVGNRVLVLGVAEPVPYLPWGSAAGANIALETTRYSVATIGPGETPNQTGTDSYSYSLPYDESVSAFDVSVTGNGFRDLTRGQIWGVSVEQRLPANLFLQLDFNRERAERIVVNTHGAAAIRADPNLYLPDRVTPNPNFGRYYVDLQDGFQPTFNKETQEARAMLSYEFDLTGRSNWQKWLGRHRLAAMYLRSEFFQQNQGFRARIIPPTLTSPGAIIDTYTAATLNTFAGRYYLSDPADRSTGNTYHVTLPFDPASGVTTFTLPDGSTYMNGYENPYGGQGAGNNNKYITESKLLAVQNFFLKGRLVTSFGLRGDSVRQATRQGRRLTASSTSAFESIWKTDPPENWSVYTRGDTTTMGAVVHPLPWFSVFYNQSSTWNPPPQTINPLDGTRKLGPTGDGKDYGLMLRFLGNRVSLRLNKYVNTSGPNISVGYRNAIRPVIEGIERTLAEHVENGLISPPPAPLHYDPYNSNISDFYSDQVSRGYEAELVTNPTRNWRLALNGSHSTATESNIGREWTDFIEFRAPVWSQHATLAGPGAGSTTIGTRYLAILQTLNLMRQADGQKVEQGREWRANLVTRYGFTEGILRGAFVGGGYRWRSKQVLGYRLSTVDNVFNFEGAPAQLSVPALKNPIFGDPVNEFDGFLGYSRRVGKKMNWRVQLNIRNLFNDRDPMKQRANLSAGFVSIYTVPEPRSFILTNTFTF